MNTGDVRGVSERGLWKTMIAGTVGGAIGGWISAGILAFSVRHVFETTPLTGLVWTGRVAAWYTLAGLLVGALAAATSLMIRGRTTGGLSTVVTSRRGIAIVSIGLALLLTFGFVFNFSIYPRPIHVDLGRIIANVIVAITGITAIYASALAVARGDRRTTRPAWLLLFPLAAACTWTLPLTPDPRLMPKRFVAGDPSACPTDEATRLATTRSGPQPNLVFLTVDTLRADHLSAYGYPRSTSPFLGRLATDAVLFERTFATKASTSTSIASFLTSRLPWAHGVSHPSEILPEDNLTLAEVLKAAGYKTGAVVENGNVFPLFRYNQGFDTYDYGTYNAAEISDRAISWLSTQARQPFFLWIHYIDPHSPYAPPAAYASMFVDDQYYADDPLSGPYPDTFRGATPVDPAHDQSHHLNKSWYIAQYDGEIRYTDEQIARVYEKLESLGRTEDTWFVVSADHGECFGEQEYFGHGELAHDCGLHVPLIIRPPGGVVARRVSDVASMIDVVPTLLAGMGFRETGCFQGKNWLGELQGHASIAKSHAIPALGTAGFITHVGGGNRYFLHDGEWKLVKRDLDWMFDLRSPLSVFWLWNSLSEGGLDRDELYDLKADPAETRNIILEAPERARALEDELIARLGMTGPLHAPATRLSSRNLDAVAPDILESLKVLGYME